MKYSKHIFNKLPFLHHFFLQTMFSEIDPPVESVYSALAKRVEFSSSSIT